MLREKREKNQSYLCFGLRTVFCVSAIELYFGSFIYFIFSLHFPIYLCLWLFIFIFISMMLWLCIHLSYKFINFIVLDSFVVLCFSFYSNKIIVVHSHFVDKYTKWTREKLKFCEIFDSFAVEMVQVIGCCCCCCLCFCFDSTVYEIYIQKVFFFLRSFSLCVSHFISLTFFCSVFCFNMFVCCFVLFVFWISLYLFRWIRCICEWNHQNQKPATQQTKAKKNKNGFFSRKQNTLKGCCHLSKRNITFEMFIWWFGSVIWSICRWIHTHTSKQTKMFVIHIITKRQHFKERQKMRTRKPYQNYEWRSQSTECWEFCEHCVIDLHYSKRKKENYFTDAIIIEQKQCKFKYSMKITRRYIQQTFLNWMR